MKCCTKLYRLHVKPLNRFPPWHFPTCNAILKAASCDGNSVAFVFSSHTDVDCSSIFSYPWGLLVYYGYIFQWLKPHQFESYSLALLFSLHPSNSPGLFFQFLGMPRNESLYFHHCESELSMANILHSRNGCQMCKTENKKYSYESRSVNNQEAKA